MLAELSTLVGPLLPEGFSAGTKGAHLLSKLAQHPPVAGRIAAKIAGCKPGDDT